MNEQINWNDLRLFLAVAHHGGLSGAIGETGLSGPTLGRRMLALERSTGRDLFIRHAKGYDLTEEGQSLLARATGIASQMEQLVPESPVQRVKISAGIWTTKFLCSHAQKISENDVALRFVAADHVLDILHREVVIGVRNKRPNQIGLAAQKIGPVNFAIYGEGNTWVHVLGQTPSANWVAQQAGEKIEVTHAGNALDLAIAGVARAVLPTFIGDSVPRLARQSGHIADLRHDQWVVSHDSDRHLPQVRRCLDRIVETLINETAG